MAMKEITITTGKELVLPVAEWIGFYTVPSAAKRLGVSRQRVHELIEGGKLEGARLYDQDGDLIKVVVSKRSVQAFQEYRTKRAELVAPSFA
jgi:excisionase family DNA binding protein